MAGAKCQRCGLMNFGTDATCRRCGTMLGEPSGFGAPQYQAATPYVLPAQPATRRSAGLPLWVKVLVGCLAGVVIVTVVATSVLVMQRLKPQWKRFASPDGSFVVSMPGVPVEKRQVEDTENGPLYGNSYSLMTLGGDEYMVMYHDFANAQNFVEDDYELLDHACEGLQESGFKIKERKRATIQGFSAYDMTVEIPQEVLVRARTARHIVIWASPRLYQVSVATRQPSDLETDGKKFIDSFAILNR